MYGPKYLENVCYAMHFSLAEGAVNQFTYVEINIETAALDAQANEELKKIAHM